MTLSTKDLKKQVLDVDPKFTELYTNKINPLVNTIREKEKEIDRLFQPDPTPGEAVAILEKYKKLTEEIKKTNKKLLSVISDIEHDYHIKIIGKNFPFNFINRLRIIDCVECIFINDLYREPRLSEKKQFLNSASISFLKKNNAEMFIADDFLHLQIDLTYDKNEILDSCDDVISKAQSIIGKTNKRAKKAVIERLFDLLFKDYYLSSRSKSDALDKVVKDFKTIGLKIEAETLDKKYIPDFKKRYGIKDVRYLKGVYVIK
ncbi:MAG: hypothetical protein U9O65_07160 [Thermotogota bacterium]|nr:hypothetical protein [Thermotogota bacterium]